MLSSPILIGNTFPFTLVRRPVRIELCTLAVLQVYAARQGVVSFWGHANTLAAAGKVFGFDLTPATVRPVLALNEDHLPTLDGVVFDEVWVLSPNYADGFRPAIGEEVPAEQISGWQVLRVVFESIKYSL